MDGMDGTDGREQGPVPSEGLQRAAELVPLLHERFAGRNILLVGESWMIQFFVALTCLLHATDPTSVVTDPSTSREFHWREPSLLRKRCHGAQKCHYESASVSFASGLRVSRAR